jgi:hypothetical protein
MSVGDGFERISVAFITDALALDGEVEESLGGGRPCL